MAPQKKADARVTVSNSFWETKTMDEMSQDEWESLCDGCGKCCMAKIIDDDTDELHFTTVACRLFDPGNCRCKDYENRQKKVSDCVKLTPANVGEIAWLPDTCAYRLLHEGRPLFDWHPLVSGDPGSVQKAGMSMFGQITAFEDDMNHDGDYLHHLVESKL